LWVLQAPGQVGHLQEGFLLEQIQQSRKQLPRTIICTFTHCAYLSYSTSTSVWRNRDFVKRYITSNIWGAFPNRRFFKL